MEGQTDFADFMVFSAMNIVDKTGKLSTHFIYFDIYTNDNRSN